MGELWQAVVSAPPQLPRSLPSVARKAVYSLSTPERIEVGSAAQRYAPWHSNPEVPMYRAFRSSAPFWLATCLLAQDGAVAKPQSPAAAEFQQINAELDAANAAYSKALKELTATAEYKQAVADKNREAQAELMKKIPRPDVAALGKKAFSAAEKYAGKDDAIAFLGFALLRANDKELAQKAAEVIVKDHSKSPKLLELVENPLYALPVVLGKEKANAFFDKVAADNPDVIVQAWTLYWKATTGARGKDASDADKAATQKLIAKAEQLAEGNELADRIRAPRFEKERLQIGMEAPDIEGVDLDGKAFKLSDYRGKVVVVDFWGDW